MLCSAIKHNNELRKQRIQFSGDSDSTGLDVKIIRSFPNSLLCFIVIRLANCIVNADLPATMVLVPRLPFQPGNVGPMRQVADGHQVAGYESVGGSAVILGLGHPRAAGGHETVGHAILAVAVRVFFDPAI